jgi:hypothetical protein
VCKILLINYIAVSEVHGCCNGMAQIKDDVQRSNSYVVTHSESLTGNYSCLKVDLIFTRDQAFYFTTVFIPGIILVTSSFITFWLEWNAVPARVMIGKVTFHLLIIKI